MSGGKKGVREKQKEEERKEGLKLNETKEINLEIRNNKERKRDMNVEWDWEERQRKKNGGKRVCVQVSACMFTCRGELGQAPRLPSSSTLSNSTCSSPGQAHGWQVDSMLSLMFKPPRARSKFNIVVGFRHFFQHCKPFTYTPL